MVNYKMPSKEIPLARTVQKSVAVNMNHFFLHLAACYIVVTFELNKKPKYQSHLLQITVRDVVLIMNYEQWIGYLSSLADRETIPE